MPFASPSRALRWIRCAGWMAGAVCLAAACSGTAPAAVDAATRAGTHGARKIAKIAALSPWELAERGRDALEAMPEGDRTQADYTRAMDLYRAIYHANPADVHAPAAVNAVAELLAEQGRSLNDAKSSKAAVGQYEFLRTQYPASSLGAQALLAEGQIEEDELGDKAAAASAYKLLLKEHPKSEQAEEAKAGLASLQVQGTRDKVQGKAAAGNTAGAKGQVSRSAHPDFVAENEAPAGGLDQTVSKVKPETRSQRAAASEGSALPAMAQTSGTRISVAPTARVAVDAPAAAAKAERVAAGDNGDANATKRGGKKALVTGIRHWSTATYTRVAIDLGDGVTYEAARVPNPDRIFFDLHGTRLAQELVGKSFLVTDDGFLKRIRAAQYSDDVTRVVLDVNDVTEYSAFLLPNPYRLIIDIHGGKGDKVRGTPDDEPLVAVEAPAPRAAVTVKPTAARPVPNAVATKSSPSEVVDLSEMPGKVDATSEPTSKPISAVVDAGNRDQGTVTPASHDRSPGTPTGNSGRRAAAAADPANGDDAGTSGAHQPPARTQPTTLSAKTRKSKAKAADGATVADATPARAAVPTADGETSLVRALGLKIGRIVIDAGHGGHDSGTLGVDGIEEKDVVLDVALRLGKLLSDRLGAEVIYTRSDDTFVPLETRTAIANKAQADLFLSIHANSSPDESARGVETYYLNFTSDPTALDVAARENAVSDQSIHQLSDLVKKIALKDKIAESREFAADVEQSLYGGLHAGNAGLKDRGVKKAPFVVLIGANMPSILAEISFVTNPKDAEQLTQPEYRQRVAESLYKGIARYEGGLSGPGRKEGVATERAAVGQ
jgi:N-acetylmuramoyl-L-alanine amidase